MTEQEHDQIHQQHEREADDLERQSEKLEEQIKHVRDDWKSKQGDETIPGARPDPDEHRDEPPPEADITPGD